MKVEDELDPDTRVDQNRYSDGGVMKRIILTGILAVTILATGTAWGQLTSAPPQLSPLDPDLSATMKALEDKLRSTGRVTWTQEMLHWKKVDNYSYKTVVERKTLWEQAINVSADSKNRGKPPLYREEDRLLRL
jgi:hypothetical protein